MSWGAMMGLGQGLQQAAGMFMDYNKDKMRNELEMEREKRREALDLAKEQRQMEQFGGAYEFDRENGLKYRVNKAGNRMADPTPISADELAAYEREQETARLDSQIKANTAAKGGLELVLKQDEVTNLATDRDLARRLEEARIQSEQARAGSHNRANRGSRGSSDAVTPTKADVETAVANRYKSLIDEAKSEYNVSEVAIQAALARAVENEAKRGLPYGSTFQQTLTNLIGSKAARRDTIKSGTN